MKRFKEWWQARQRRRALAAVGFDETKFRTRLELIDPLDPLWPLLLAYFDASVLAECAPIGVSGLDDAEAHRLRGRIGMLRDVKRELERAYLEAHAKVKEKGLQSQ